MAADKVAKALGELAQSMDETIVEYIVGVVDDAGCTGAEELQELIGPMMTDADGAPLDDDAVRDVCERLAASFGGDAASAATKKAEDNVAQRLERTVVVGEATGEASARALEMLSERDRANPTRDAAHARELAKQKEQQSKKARKAVEKQKAQMAAEMRTAQEAALAEQQRQLRAAGARGEQHVKDFMIYNIDLSFGSNVLVANATLQLCHGRRYGLVGKNGTGKSTLLRALAARELAIPPNLRVLHVEQEVVGDDTTVLQSVLECDTERERLLAVEREILADKKGDNDDRLNAVYARLQEIDSDSAPGRAATILAGLGFSDAAQRRPTSDYSGGWRMRVSLARALFAEPDLLLLDEPTNMLDMSTVIWLENYLQTWRTCLLVVSHAREFLNAVATDIIHLYAQTLTPYRGDYDSYEKTRNERLKNQASASAAQAKHREHIQKFIDRWRYNAKRASIAQSRIKVLNKMELIPEVVEDPTMAFVFPKPEPLAPPVVRFEEVAFGYNCAATDADLDKKLLFRNLDFSLDMESRVAIVGDNGQGKTTILKLLTKQLDATRGYVYRNPRLRVGYFSQHHVDQLDLDATPVEFMEREHKGADRQACRQQLGRYGITGDLALQQMKTLSGGQKSRVVFAVMGMSKPHMMVLDEPTNHLDIETVEIVGRALLDYEGGIVMVTHDERLITIVCNEMWIAHQGRVRVFDGDFAMYKHALSRGALLPSA